MFTSTTFKCSRAHPSAFYPLPQSRRPSPPSPSTSSSWCLSYWALRVGPPPPSPPSCSLHCVSVCVKERPRRRRAGLGRLGTDGARMKPAVSFTHGRGHTGLCGWVLCHTKSAPACCVQCRLTQAQRSVQRRPWEVARLTPPSPAPPALPRAAVAFHVLFRKDQGNEVGGAAAALVPPLLTSVLSRVCCGRRRRPSAAVAAAAAATHAHTRPTHAPLHSPGSIHPPARPPTPAGVFHYFKRLPHHVGEPVGPARPQSHARLAQPGALPLPPPAAEAPCTLLCCC